MCRDPTLHGAGVKRAPEPQSPGKRATTLGLVEAFGSGVQVRASARLFARLVGSDEPMRSLEHRDDA